MRGPTMRGIQRVLLFAAVTTVLAVSLFPVLWMMMTSLKPKVETFSIPPVWAFLPTLENYREVLRGGQDVSAMLPRVFSFYLRNSAIVAVVTACVSTVVGGMASYAITRLRFAWRDPLANAIVGSRALPPIATLVPIFLLMRSINLADTLLGLILVYCAMNTPFAAWMLRGFMAAIPKDLEDAATVDGCSRAGTLFRIVLPLVLPGMVATAIFGFTLAWNELTFALFLTSNRAVTLPVVASFTKTEVGTLWGPMAAIGTMMMLPIWIFSLFAMRWLVHGLTSGAVKG